MKLLHYSRAPLVEKHDATQDDHFKPSGLWVSVEGEDDWRNWCEGESFGIDEYKWQTVIALTGRGKPVLQLGRDRIDAFTAKYENANSPLRQYNVPRRSDLHQVNWHAVAAQHSGVIIAPYSWAHRHSLMWYYPWDCASGCLWDADAWEIAAPSEAVEFRKSEAA